MLYRKDIEKLEKIKSILIRKHKQCKGKGYIDFEGGIKPCICMDIFSYIIELQKSGIPQDYWELHIDTLSVHNKKREEVKYFIKYLDNAIEQGQGLFLMGEKRGVGKTSLACEIGKEAIIKRYNVYYNIMQNIVSDKFTDEHNIETRIKEADLVIIDEFDKVMMSKGSSLTKNIENFLREILPIRKSVIICSNSNIEIMDTELKLESLIKRYMQILEIKGKDYSVIKNKQLKDRLKEKVNYFSDSIKSSAKRFLANENIANEREWNKMFEE